MFTRTGGLLHAAKFYLCNPSQKMLRTKTQSPCSKKVELWAIFHILAKSVSHLANTKDRTRIITHFISKLTNRGSVEFSGKAVSRGGGLGMEIPCVYNFDGPSKHVNLLQQLIDVGNNPAVRTEVDADSGKQRRPKRKKDASNDGSKRKKK